MLTNRQIVAARGLAGLSQEDLANLSGISRAAIARIENGSTELKPSVSNAINEAFERIDIEFTEGEGVRKKLNSIATYVGHHGFIDFLMDVYRTVDKGEKLVQVSNVDEMDFLKWEGAEAQAHQNRMESIRANYQILTCSGDNNLVATAYAEYRWLPENLFGSIPFYLYGTKTALIAFEEKNVFVYTIDHPKITTFFRWLFSKSWDQAQKT